MSRSLHPPETSSIDRLPDDVLLLILSFLPNLAVIARTSILSRRWRNLWHRLDCLDFDAINILPRDRLETSFRWYVAWVDKVIKARVALPGLPSVREFRIQYPLDEDHTKKIDHWIDYAIANRVQTLQLEFSVFGGFIHPTYQYKLSPESWYRAPSGVSNLKYLKSLSLSCVSVTKTFVEFILSSCPHLEDLSLFFAATCNDLDISSALLPLQLKRLILDKAEDFALTKLCAPYLTSLYHESEKFNPQMIDTPLLTDLAIGGGAYSQHIMQYLEHFWTYLPRLEKLHLIMYTAQDFMLKPTPELGKLKYLKIQVNWDTNPIFSRIIDFIKACPVLETFAFQMYGFDVIPRRSSIRERERKKILWKDVDRTCSFRRLKVLELYGGDGKTIDQEVVKCIIIKAPNLEKLYIDACRPRRCPILPWPNPKIVDVVEAKAKKLCKKCSRNIDINVVR